VKCPHAATGLGQGTSALSGLPRPTPQPQYRDHVQYVSGPLTASDPSPAAVPTVPLTAEIAVWGLNKDFYDPSCEIFEHINHGTTTLVMTLLSVCSFCIKHGTINHHSIFPNLFLPSLGVRQDQFQVAHDNLSPCRANQQLPVTRSKFIRNQYSYSTQTYCNALEILGYCGKCCSFVYVAVIPVTVSRCHLNTDACAWPARLVSVLIL
jgi:hypothetical protein